MTAPAGLLTFSFSGGWQRTAALVLAARWRAFDPTQATKPLGRTWAERQGDLFDHRGSDR